MHILHFSHNPYHLAQEGTEMYKLTIAVTLHLRFAVRFNDGHCIDRMFLYCFSGSGGGTVPTSGCFGGEGAYAPGAPASAT